MTDASEPPNGIELANEPDFRIGPLLVCPSSCRVEFGDRQERVEPRVMEVLVALGREPERTVSRDQLVDLCWGGRIVSDEAVNRVVAKARQLARSFDPPPFTIETIPKVGFRLNSLQPSDERGKRAAQAGETIRAWLRRWQARLGPRRTVALLIAVIAIAGAAIFGAASLGPPRHGLVEVMLFEAEPSDDRELRSLSTMLGESVVRVLTASGISTISRPRGADSGSSGADAEFRIAGTLRRNADAFVANAQILDRSSGVVLWSTAIERPTEFMAGLDERVANDIAGALFCALEEREHARGRMTVEVLALFINACAAAMDLQNPERMLNVTRRLVEAAPNLAGAQAMHAFALMQTAKLGLRNTREEATRLSEEARAAAQRALRLNPRTASAYVVLANTHYYAPGAPNWLEMERNLRQALEIDPELTQARLEHAWTLHHVGRMRAALDAFSGLTRAADPRARSDLLLVAVLQAQFGNRGAADAMLGRLARIYPEQVRDAEWGITIWWDDADIALSRIRTLARGSASLEDDLPCLEQYLFAVARRGRDAIRGLPGACSGIETEWRIRMLARQGDVDAAYTLFEATRTQTISQKARILYYPEMREFRRDRRFMPLARRMGLVDYWLATNRWPDFCSEPDLPYDCRTAARAA